MRLIILMIFMSVLAVLTLCLWNYIFQGKLKGKELLIGVGFSLLAGALLVAYGFYFPYVNGSPLFPLVHGSALGALTWILMLFMAFPFLLIGAIGCFSYRLCRHFKRKKRPMPEQTEQTVSRRTFVKGVAAAVPVAALATSGVGNLIGEKYLSLTKHDVYFPHLPDYLEGYKIGQLSDTHMGLFFGPDELRQSLEAAASQHVNRLELTGDLIDELSLLPEYEKILNEYAPYFPDGIDFCYGNHEYYRGIGQITAMLDKTPVRILRNTSYCASPGMGKQLVGRTGQDTQPFYIAGTDYSFTNGNEAFQAEREKFVTKALQGIPEKAFVLLLAHHSAFIDEAFEHHIPLTLCGHTHGAQVAPIGPIVQAVGFKYLRGMYQKGDSYGYVNRGTGHWLPLRLFCSREVSIFTLHTKH